MITVMIRFTGGEGWGSFDKGSKYIPLGKLVLESVFRFSVISLYSFFEGFWGHV